MVSLISLINTIGPQKENSMEFLLVKCMKTHLLQGPVSTKGDFFNICYFIRLVTQLNLAATNQKLTSLWSSVATPITNSAAINPTSNEPSNF